MASTLQRVLETPSLRRAVRASADWVDLQYSQILSNLAAVAPRTHGRLLDVGCGEKPFESIFLPYVSEYVGIEYADTFESTKSSDRKTKPDFYYDGKTLPFESRSFDTVISIQVLEHTPDPRRLVQEIGRVVKKDGLVVMNAPFSFRLHEEPFDYFRYTPHGWRALFDEAGLEVTEIRPMGDLWSVLGHKLNSYLAFRVARIEAIAQMLGKHGHEGVRNGSARWWTFPVILPTMALVSAAARILDRVAPDGTEALSYQVIGRPKRAART